jgi:DnaJ-class molecular chaperone
MPNYYDVLEIAHDADDQAIKKAYMKLSLKYHPDRNPQNLEEATSKFQEINAAYEVLKDPHTRMRYNSEMSGGGFHDQSQDINDIFNMMFGGGMPGVQVFHMGPRGMNRGMSSPFGGMNMGGMNMGGMNMGGMNMGGMNMMGGMGGMNMGGMNMMGGMGGMNMGGMNINIVPDIFEDHFFQQFHRQAPHNNTISPIVKEVIISLEQAYTGTAVFIEIERAIVQNGMQMSEIESVSINVPRGIRDNETLLLTGKGNSTEHTVGDLHILVKIENKTIFEQQGDDLYMKKKITLKEALCGFAFDIKHLNGKLLQFNNIVNPSIIKPNFKKVVEGLGMIRDNKQGNLIIQFDIMFPEALTREQITQLNGILV